MDVGKYFWQRPCRYEQCDFFKHMLKWSKGHSVMSASFATPWTSPWNSPVQNMGVGNCFLLQGIFPTQGLNPGFPYCRWILYHLSHQGSPYIFFKKPSVSFPSILSLFLDYALPFFCKGFHLNCLTPWYLSSCVPDLRRVQPAQSWSGAWAPSHRLRLDCSSESSRS